MEAIVTDALAEMLRAAGEPTRLRLLNLLRVGSICVCDLQGVLQLPQSTISRHLGMLRRAGLVLNLRDGIRVMYALAPATTNELKALHEFLDKVCPVVADLRRDLESLKQALRRGECVVIENPASANPMEIQSAPREP
jgi:ArsR family transcriptional regulator, arsenate/arsenite/antimonite-responsive transcriptional repressor